MMEMQEETQQNNRPLTPSQIALARSRTYILLSELYIDGVTEKTLPIIQTIPDLSTTFSQPINLDELAATYQDIFGFNVFPHQGVFLGSSSLLGGDEAMALIHAYGQAGYNHVGTADAPGHIGTELAFLAFLCGAQADALEDQQFVIAQRIEVLQADFFKEYLLRWLPPFLLAVQHQQSTFYSALATLTLAFVADHAADFRWDIDFSLPEPPELLADEKTGIKDIAAMLLRPIYSGFYLSRRGIRQLARQYQLPRGFGDREQMLTNLLRSAIQYDSFDKILVDLTKLLADWDHGYTQIIAEHPSLAPFAQVWQRRTVQSQQLLTEIQEIARFAENLPDEIEKMESLQ